MKKIIGISLAAIAGIGVGAYIAVNSNPKLKSKISNAARALKIMIDDAKLSAEQKASDAYYEKMAEEMDNDYSSVFDGCQSRCHLSDEAADECDAVDCDGCPSYYCDCFSCEFVEDCPMNSLHQSLTMETDTAEVDDYFSALAETAKKLAEKKMSSSKKKD